LTAPLIATARGVRLAVRLTPRARSEHIDAGGDGVIRVAVTTPPTENRANEALLRLLAKKWRLPRRDLSIVMSARSRNKTVHIAGDPAVLLARVGAFLKRSYGASQ
jgi:uncharacterized protein YggU (UPF0235/DUF167 family)